MYKVIKYFLLKVNYKNKQGHTWLSVQDSADCLSGCYMTGILPSGLRQSASLAAT